MPGDVGIVHAWATGQEHAISRLTACDRRILWNGFRRTFALWRDRLVLLLLIVVSVAYLRALAPTLTGVRLVALSVAAGAWAGAVALRLIKRRLAFHAAETSFAAEALNKAVARAYLSAWLCGALAASGLVFAILSWRALPLFVASFAIGAGLAAIIPDRGPLTLRPLSFQGSARSARAILAVLAAALLWLAMTRLQGADRSILATLLLLAGIQLLAPLDARSLRFEGLSGVTLARSLRRHLGPAALWYGAALLIGASQGEAAGSMPFAVAAGLLLVHVGGLLACRFTSELSAMLIVGGILLLCGTIAGLSPGYEWLALPAGLCGLLWLVLRAMRDRWLMT